MTDRKDTASAQPTLPQQQQQLISRSDIKAPVPVNVSVIPATKPSGQDAQLKMRTDIRVAAYCRVSTGDESQQTSYTNQKAYYSGLIHTKPGWKFAGLYADEGISGTSIAHRTQFNQMIADAKAGKIDYIVTKSISRFARNTLDTLTYVRELKELSPRVGIFFEKENIDTLDVRGEMVLTVLAAIAQEESHSISENIRWSIRKRFQAGVPQVNLNRLLGYDLGDNGQWVINEQQAAIVRDIFSRFIGGVSANAIAQSLNGASVCTVLGNKWTASTVLNILRNEKYAGDVVMQKTFTKDFLTHAPQKNTGELPKFYIENHHEAIICREDWQKAQSRLQRRGRGRDKKTEQECSKRGVLPAVFSVLSCGAGSDVCPMASSCPRTFHRLTYSAKATGYTDERSIAATGANSYAYSEEYCFSYPVWKHHPANDSGANACPMGAINECALKQSFMEMLYSLKRDYEANGENSRLWRDFLANRDAILKTEQERISAIGELSAINNQIEELELGISSHIDSQAEAMCGMTLDNDADLAEAVAAGEIDREDIITDIRNGLLNPEQGPQFYHVDVPEGTQAAIIAELVNDLQCRLTELQRIKASLETAKESAAEGKRSFEDFLQALLSLPEQNGAGMAIKVNGLDVDGSLMRDSTGHAKPGNRSAYNRGSLIITPERIAAAPDYLDFAEDIFRNFITKGTILLKKDEPHDRTTSQPHDLITPKSQSSTQSTLNTQHSTLTDRIMYKTAFGLTLTSTGNSRSLGSFLGFKRSGVDSDGKPDGTIDFIDQLYKVAGSKVWYKRTERKKKG